MSTLYITTQGATVQKRSGQFVVFKNSNILQNVPETHVKQIVLVGNVNLTTPTVSFCLEKQIEKMERTIRAIMSAAEDNVRYYKLCKNCAVEVQVFGGEPLAKTLSAYVV